MSLRPSFLVALVLSFAPAAVASTTYPSAVRSHLTAERIPSCTACHETSAGGAGTVTKPFGEAMMAEGLVGGSDEAALTAALDALEAAGTDSDGDGTGDIDELRAGTDPNAAAGTAGDEETVAYGFGCAGTGNTNAPDVAPALLLVVAALVRVRRRPRSRHAR